MRRARLAGAVVSAGPSPLPRRDVEDHAEVERREALALVEAPGRHVGVRETDVDRADTALARPVPTRFDQRRADAAPTLLLQHRKRLELDDGVAEVPCGGTVSCGQHGIA